MKSRLYAGTALLGICMAAQGAETPSLQVRGLVEGVPRGTRLKAEMRADYVLLDLTPGASKQAQPVEVLRMKGVGVLRMDVTIPASGSAGPTKGEIRFEKPLVPAPPGMAAMVEFPIHYSVACGDLVPDCSARTRDTTFVLEVPAGTATSFTPCLQFRRGMSAKDVLVAIGPDCQDPRMKGTRVVKE